MGLREYFLAYPDLAVSELLYVLQPPAFNGIPADPSSAGCRNPFTGTPYASCLGPRDRAAAQAGVVAVRLRALPTTSRSPGGPSLGESQGFYQELVGAVPAVNLDGPAAVARTLVELVGPEVVNVLVERFPREPVTQALGGAMTTVVEPMLLGLADVARARDAACATAMNPAACGAEFQRLAFSEGAAVCSGVADTGANDLCKRTVLARVNALYAKGRSMGILDTILSGAGTVAGALPSILPVLQTLANAGVIRGSVGNALAPMQQNPAGATGTLQGSLDLATQLGLLGPVGTVAGRVLSSPAAQGAMGAIAGELGLGALESLFGGGATCGGARPAVQAPTLFRTNACGRSSLAARTQVIGPDGAVYVVASLGRATRGSREVSVMRRIARDNGFTARRGGSGGRSRRRRFR